MRYYTLKRRQTFARPRRELFEFFERPENLEKITPDSVGFHILTPLPIKMQTGAVLDYTIRLFGFPVRWTTLISDYDPPNQFSDVALRGPYRFWHHTHTFVQDGDSTTMFDDVRFALPFGLLGRLVYRLWVRRQLDRIFSFRAKAMDEILRSDDAEASNVRPSLSRPECACK